MNELGSVSVNYVSRNLNELAHRLVGYAMQNGCIQHCLYLFFYLMKMFEIQKKKKAVSQIMV